ncbi:FliG C-terminal domain-containing protein [Buchnera aphidicola (Kurisakia onigurumii)]|uniref:FliG C-terminal domain-containing protein n=1 Tax=Buchnera aphidicola TaxID=9 RepID=UPI0031B6FF51
MNLSGIQKSALLLMIMNIELSSKVLTYLTQKEIQKIFLLNSELEKIPENIIKEVIHEYRSLYNKINDKKKIQKNNLLKILKMGLGQQKGIKLFEKINQKKNFLLNIKYLNSIPSKDIFDLIKNENIEFISIILMHIKTKKYKKIFSFFNLEIQSNIIIKISEFQFLNDSAKIELSNILDKIIYLHKLKTKKNENLKIIKNMLNSKYVEKNNIILKNIYKKNKDLTNNILLKNFTFQNILKISDSGIKKILLNIDIKTIYISIFDKNKIFKNKIIKNMSENQLNLFNCEINKKNFYSPNLIYEKQEIVLKKIKLMLNKFELSILDIEN